MVHIYMEYYSAIKKNEIRPFDANRNQKKVAEAIHIPDKTNLTIKNIIRDKEGYYIMIKGSIQEEITIGNIYAPNIRSRQNIREWLTTLKGETDI